ncbi:Retrovirus-related Pol polyprotein from transposon TNT 1-94 [Trichinella patagoniensis]|uniref:Retrovirus-related Pol polyprotein from transposon TNT 1-94 n=1 Tax=Trichinella patagoniensis TaxID=990121 RepID=A0A0V0Z5C5_9BILA|nr:Retrovirus-related Pol polyprotein from transposon TNT 1-94 [Trichinella patagoniensis]KRY07564.1 Retrovirus-related Pol polyprotein from transposon TNT 1-94 [Trichinella patagoniensis]KRY11511.1 Retrovirus-related Pol polyprotein from transposon TNT 1-94 [Trichinella patagoniensis]
MCAGGTVLWHRQKQRSVALSTTEAEYVAASEAAKDMMWLMTLFAEVTEVKQKPILFVDNMEPSSSPRIQSSTNHIDSENQKADILIKALPKTRFQNLRQQFEIVSEHMNF